MRSTMTVELTSVLREQAWPESRPSRNLWSEVSSIRGHDSTRYVVCSIKKCVWTGLFDHLLQPAPNLIEMVNLEKVSKHSSVSI